MALAEKYPQISMTLYNPGKGSIAIPFTDKHTSIKEIATSAGVIQWEYAAYLVGNKICNGKDFLILTMKNIQTLQKNLFK